MDSNRSKEEEDKGLRSRVPSLCSIATTSKKIRARNYLIPSSMLSAHRPDHFDTFVQSTIPGLMQLQQESWPHMQMGNAEKLEH